MFEKYGFNKKLKSKQKSAEREPDIQMLVDEPSIIQSFESLDPETQKKFAKEAQKLNEEGQNSPSKRSVKSSNLLKDEAHFE